MHDVTHFCWDFIGVGLVKFEIVKKIKVKSAEHRENSGTIQQKFHDSRLWQVDVANMAGQKPDNLSSRSRDH
jgi:hypothetical protein